MRSSYLILPLLVNVLAMVHSLPVAKNGPETNVTEAQMEEKIRHILTALGYPTPDIEKALKLVPEFYAQKNESHHRHERQALDIHSHQMMKTSRVPTSTAPPPPPATKTTTTTTTTTTPAPPNNLNGLLHELNIFWKG